ncbi:MAG: hypothetical protein HN884_14355, partial [Rhodospirillaceae bacterium]|nr:hypothetical protein [Rhodospirillaceae bacterium]
DTILEQELKDGTQNVFRQGLIPPLEHGSFDFSGISGVGTLARQPKVTQENGDEGLLDDIAGSNFWIVQNPAKEGVVLSDAQESFWQKISGQVICMNKSGASLSTGESGTLNVSDVDGLMIDYFDDQDCAAIIVRPDRYIYGIVKSQEDLDRQIESIQDWMAAG